MPHYLHAHLHQVFSTTTPVPLGDGSGSRTEANVALYNAAARAVLPPAVIINDLHGDIVAFCGKPSSSWLCACIFCPIQFQDFGPRFRARRLACAWLRARGATIVTHRRRLHQDREVRAAGSERGEEYITRTTHSGALIVRGTGCDVVGPF